MKKYSSHYCNKRIPTQPATYSDLNRPPISVQTGHPEVSDYGDDYGDS